MSLYLVTHLVEKGNIQWADPLAKGQHLLFELLEVDLFDGFVRFTLLFDESHEYSFLQRTQIISNVNHLACTQLNVTIRSNMLKLINRLNDL